MKGLFILFLLGGVLSFAKEETEFPQQLNATQMRKWMHAVEEMLSHISIGPLKEDFTPEYVAKRTREFALRKQTNRFRAEVASSIIQTTDTETKVCVGSFDEATVQTVIDELEQRTFQVQWLHNCKTHCIGTCLSIKVPKPTENEE